MGSDPGREEGAPGDGVDRRRKSNRLTLLANEKVRGGEGGGGGGRGERREERRERQGGE